jgi:hypothetical protein
MEMREHELHTDLKGLPYFDVDANDLDADVGRRCRIKNARWPAEHDTFTVTATQTIYDGTLAYRIVGDKDVWRFGRPARPEEIEFLAEPE